MAIDRIKKWFTRAPRLDRGRASGPSSQPMPSRGAGDYAVEEDLVSADTTIDKICNEISAALAGLLKGRKDITASAIVSIKIQKSGGDGLEAKFAICGVRGHAGAQRTHQNVHTVSITFTPTGNAHSGSKNEFDKAFEQLQPFLDTSSDYAAQVMAIDLDFSITDQGRLSILAAGNVKDESTHHVTVKLTRPA